MTIEREEVVKTVERSQSLAVEAAQTLVDSACLPPRQALQFGEAMLQTLEANYGADRDLVGKLVRQMLEGQLLWWKFVQESLQTSALVYAHTSRAMLAAGNRDVATIRRQRKTDYVPDGHVEKRPVAAGR